MSLHQAITSGRLHQARLLLDIGANVNSGDKHSRTPFMLTALVEQETIGLKMAKMLLDKGAGVETVDMRGRTALSYACLYGREKIIQLLLDETDFDFIINLADKDGNTPLMYAAMSGNTLALRLVLEIILKYGISVDLRNSKGFSAYLLASKLGHVQCAHVLKAEGGASGGIRDMEFFLCDKEWVKKGRKDQRCEAAREHSSVVTLSPNLRPKTCPNWSNHGCSKIAQESNRWETHRNPFHRINANVKHLSRTPLFSPTVEGEHMRTVSRLTMRSEPTRPREFRLKRNCWLGDVGRGTSRDNDSVSVQSIVLSESTRTSSIPTAARTQTPDLHAIFSHYVRLDTAIPMVTVADKRAIKLTEDSHLSLESRQSGLKARERRQGRMSLTVGKKNVLSQ